MQLSDLKLLDFGHKHQIVGVIFSNDESQLLCHLPDEEVKPLSGSYLLKLSLEDWEKVLYQSDVLDTEFLGPAKGIVRKSQRQIDQNVSWAAYYRDDYTCRYCGFRKPLSVDHVDLWEAGGVSVIDNVVSACKPCNRKRGNRTYEEWIESGDYRHLSKGLTLKAHQMNLDLLNELPRLRALRTKKVRSR